MTSTFSSLRTNDVHSDVQSLLDVLRSTHHLMSISYSTTHTRTAGETHVHTCDPCLVQLFNNLFGRYSDGADEEFGLLIDDDIDEFIQLSFVVVVVGLSGRSAERGDEQVDAECY